MGLACGVGPFAVRTIPVFPIGRELGPTLPNQCVILNFETIATSLGKKQYRRIQYQDILMRVVKQPRTRSTLTLRLYQSIPELAYYRRSKYYYREAMLEIASTLHD